jgi:dolichyl-phosphate-mannose-protein mannosyltransferase
LVRDRLRQPGAFKADIGWSPRAFESDERATQNVAMAKRQPLADRSRALRPLGVLLAGALAVRIALTPLYAYLPNGYLDEGFWKDWMLAIHRHGVLNIFRNSDTDYVGYHWVLWALASVYALIGGSYTPTSPSLHVLVKTPSIIFDVALIITVYAATAALARQEGRYRGERLALAAAAVIAFQPAVLYDSAVWAQTDAAVTVAMLLSMLPVANGAPTIGWGVWTIGFLIKPHPIIVVPILLALTLRRGGPTALVRGMVAVGAIGAIVLGPWLVHGDAANIATTYKALFDANYERLSASAWNLWWFRDVAAHPPPDTAVTAAVPLMTYRAIGVALTAMSGVLATTLVWRLPTLRSALVGGAYLAFAFYILPVSTHERYLYPFLALLLPVVVMERRWLWLYAPGSITLFLNMAVVAPPIRAFSGRWVESPFSLAIAAVNVVLFGAFTVVMSILSRSTFAGGRGGGQEGDVRVDRSVKHAMAGGVHR